MAGLLGNGTFLYGVFACYLILLGWKDTVSSAEVIVNTQSEVLLHEGQFGTLPCTVDRRLFAVYWKKGLTYQSSNTIVFIDLTYHAGAKGGEGYNAGLYDIDPNYSLIIKNVSSVDSGRYYCEVSDFVTGILFRNVTKVFVFGKPGLPKTVLQRSRNPNNGTYILTWEPPTDTGGYPIISYTIYICKSDGHSSFKDSACTKHEVNNSVNALALREVYKGHVFHVAVAASNEMGEGSPSSLIIDLVGDEACTTDMTDGQNINITHYTVLPGSGEKNVDVTLICSITIAAVVFLGLIVALSIFLARKKRKRHRSETRVRYSAVAHETSHARTTGNASTSNERTTENKSTSHARTARNASTSHEKTTGSESGAGRATGAGVATGAAAGGVLGGLVAGPAGAVFGATVGAGVGRMVVKATGYGK